MRGRGGRAALMLATVGMVALLPAGFTPAAERVRHPGPAAGAAAPKPTPQKPGPHDIRIGLLLTGGASAELSDDIATGLAMALADAGGRVNGRKLDIVRADGDGSADAAPALMRRLAAAEPGIDVFVGPATAGEIPSLQAAAAAVHIPLLVPVAASSAAAAASCSPYVLQLAPAGDQMAGQLGSWIATQRPARQVYLLAPSANGGRAEAAAFKRQFEAAGGEIVGEEYVSGATPDFSPYFAKLRLVGADTMYAPFSGAAAVALANQYDEAGLAKRIGLLGLRVPREIRSEAISAVDYVATLDTPENHRFRSEFARRYGHAPSEQAARGYDAGRIIVEGLKHVQGHTEDRERLAAALAATTFSGPRGPVHAGRRIGTPLDELYVVRTRGGDAPSTELLARVTVAVAVPAAGDACAAALTPSRKARASRAVSPLRPPRPAPVPVRCFAPGPRGPCHRSAR